jgi:hypothetical protein
MRSRLQAGDVAASVISRFLRPPTDLLKLQGIACIPLHKFAFWFLRHAKFWLVSAMPLTQLTRPLRPLARPPVAAAGRHRCRALYRTVAMAKQQMLASRPPARPPPPAPPGRPLHFFSAALTP